MTRNEWIYGALLEILWLAFAAILVFLVMDPVRLNISAGFYQYLFGAGFLFVTYLRLAVWGGYSLLLKSIWIKLLLFFGNLGLFFFLLHEFNIFRDVFDSYNYTLPEDQFQDILSGTDVDMVMRITRLTLIIGVGSLISVVMLELRLVWMIFRSRQLERLIKGRSKGEQL